MRIRIWTEDCGLHPYEYSKVDVDEGPIKGSLRVSHLTEPSSAPNAPIALFAQGYWELLEIVDFETGEEGKQEMSFEDFRDKILGEEGKSEDE